MTTSKPETSGLWSELVDCLISSYLKCHWCGFFCSLLYFSDSIFIDHISIIPLHFSMIQVNLSSLGHLEVSHRCAKIRTGRSRQFLFDLKHQSIVWFPLEFHLYFSLIQVNSFSIHGNLKASHRWALIAWNGHYMFLFDLLCHSFAMLCHVIWFVTHMPVIWFVFFKMS